MKSLFEILIIVISIVPNIILLIGILKYVTSGGEAGLILIARIQIFTALLTLTFLTGISLLLFFLLPPPLAIDTLSVSSLLINTLLPLFVGSLSVLSSISIGIRKYLLKDRAATVVQR